RWLAPRVAIRKIYSKPSTEADFSLTEPLLPASFAQSTVDDRVILIGRTSRRGPAHMAESPHPRSEPVSIGIDVGSTTVKAVVVDPETKDILWSDYQRHQTKQPEMVLEFLERIEAAFPNVPRDRIRTFITGSGGGPIGPHLGSKF